MEDAMNKTLITIATAAIAATTLFTSEAEAGMKFHIGFGFPIGAFAPHGGSGGYEYRSYKRHKYVERRVKHKVYSAKKKDTSDDDVAKAEETKPAPVVAKVETENSSITMAALPAPVTSAVDETAPDKTTEPVQTTAEVVETTPVTEEKTTGKLDCKKFFPAVGMTLSVHCE
jgi:hypothetical protein